MKNEPLSDDQLKKLGAAALCVAGACLEDEIGNIKPKGSVNIDIGGGLVVNFNLTVTAFPFPEIKS